VHVALEIERRALISDEFGQHGQRIRINEIKEEPTWRKKP
jgi:hypothetical protein